MGFTFGYSLRYSPCLSSAVWLVVSYALQVISCTEISCMAFLLVHICSCFSCLVNIYSSVKIQIGYAFQNTPNYSFVPHANFIIHLHLFIKLTFKHLISTRHCAGKTVPSIKEMSIRKYLHQYIFQWQIQNRSPGDLTLWVRPGKILLRSWFVSCTWKGELPLSCQDSRTIMVTKTLGLHICGLLYWWGHVRRGIGHNSFLSLQKPPE